MCRTPTPYPTAIVRRLHLCILAVLLVAGASVADAALPEPFRNALPLPMDRSIDGYTTAREPALYAVDVTAPGLVVIETHATGLPLVRHHVRVFDPSGQQSAANLPLPAMQGRHVQWIPEPGTYFVEVRAAGPGSASFRLYAWTAARQGDSLEPMDETDEILGGYPSLEPMDETDELIGGHPSLEPMDETDEILGGYPSLEPMDETDEILGGHPSLEPMDETDELIVKAASWQEVPGYGLLETAAGGLQVRRHPWCSWTERPDLLSTFTCARQLRIDGTRTILFRPISPNVSEMIGLVLPAAARLTLETSDGFEAPTALFDAEGRLLAEPAAGEPMWIEAGRVYLRVDAGPGREVVLDVEID